MRDKTFGEMSYEYGWRGTVQLDWLGKEETVDFNLYGEEEEGISDYQRECFSSFMAAWPDLQEQVLKEVFSYYRKLSGELGYGDGSHPDYPLLRDPSEIKDHIHLDQINIFEEGIFDGRCVGLAFTCSWDDENGAGVLLIDEQVKEVGYQDLVF